MKPEKLVDIKKELLTREVRDLSEICLRMAKYKKENKELLSYLLFSADDPLDYAETIKSGLEDNFLALKRHSYYDMKTLRKILRVVNRHIKFTGSRQVEIELLLWFCRNFLTYADTRSSYKPLGALFVRQLEKIMKTFEKIHEDLQFDYRTEIEGLINEASKKLRSFPKRQFENL